jgi:pimeloyl-ACP methyl ester carboxylesterase
MTETSNNNALAAEAGPRLKLKAIVSAVLLAAGVQVVQAQTAGCRLKVDYSEVTGVLPSGASWGMRKPAHWTGLLINDFDYVPSRNSERSCYWLRRGYAVSGTDRNPQRTVNYDPAREIQDLLTVVDRFTQRYGRPTRVVQYGHSGGGFNALNLAELYPDRIDGVVAGCAHEQVPLMNMMYDGWFVLQALIAPDLPIANFSTLAAVSDAATKWRAALTAAQQTPIGRARIALAITLGQWPSWTSQTKPKPDPADLVALQQAMFDTALVNAGQPGGQSRYMSEHAGGSPTPRQLSWNDSIDYAQFLSRGEPVNVSATQALYGQAGANLASDLATLASAPRLTADPVAIDFWAQPGRTSHGLPRVPVVRFHTIGDNAVPPQIIDGYVQKMEANGGNQSLYRTTVVDRPGHCLFDASESAAAIEALLRRLDTGVWPDTSPAGMNAIAKQLFPASTPRFIEYTPVRHNRPQNNPQGGL